MFFTADLGVSDVHYFGKFEATLAVEETCVVTLCAYKVDMPHLMLSAEGSERSVVKHYVGFVVLANRSVCLVSNLKFQGHPRYAATIEVTRVLATCSGGSWPERTSEHLNQLDLVATICGYHTLS